MGTKGREEEIGEFQVFCRRCFTQLWQARLKTLVETAIKYGEIEPVPEHKITLATDQMKLDLGRGLTLEIHLTP